jgi:hypothetical protein
VFASALVLYEQLMNVSKLRCRMEPARCAAVRGFCYPTPSPYEGTVRNVEVVETCGFTAEYPNISEGRSLTEGQMCIMKRFMSKVRR